MINTSLDYLLPVADSTSQFATHISPPTSSLLRPLEKQAVLVLLPHRYSVSANTARKPFQRLLFEPEPLCATRRPCRTFHSALDINQLGHRSLWALQPRLLSPLLKVLLGQALRDTELRKGGLYKLSVWTTPIVTALTAGSSTVRHMIHVNPAPEHPDAFDHKHISE